MQDIDLLRFPVGPLTRPDSFRRSDIDEWIKVIEDFPYDINAAVDGCTDHQLDLPYRPGGWTVRQVVHHCADSHMQSVTRFRWALTEDTPTIKAYYENRWAELSDYTGEIAPSLQILTGLHVRWAGLMKGLTDDELKKGFVHPETGDTIALWQNIALYEWHCRHHLAHIKQALKYNGDFE